MNSYMLQGESDVELIRDLILHLPHESTIVDFEENILLASVRATTRLWRDTGVIIGFAFVDDWNNLRFEIGAASRSAQLEDEIIEWGIRCIKNRKTKTGEPNTLDASFYTANNWQIALLQRSGFVRSELRTLRYARSLSEPIMPQPFPPGFSWRCVGGEHEVENLVALHRAAFGTDKMTVERRLAIMHGPDYERELDLLAMAPDGKLAASCICTLEAEMDSEIVGFTDPIGTHPRFQKQGVGKALVTTGLLKFKERDTSIVKLSTLSNNLPMQGLAQSLGFICEAEKLWFSKEVT